jgi:exosome complex RNA-binding protein Csl4
MANKPKSNTDYIDQLNAEWGQDSDAQSGETPEKPREDFAAMLNESSRKATRKFAVGDRVRAEILVLGKEDVFVSTGPQSEGVVRRLDLLDE